MLDGQVIRTQVKIVLIPQMMLQLQNGQVLDNYLRFKFNNGTYYIGGNGTEQSVAISSLTLCCIPQF